MDLGSFKEKIFRIASFSDFETLAIQLFKYQIKANPFYKKYCESLNIDLKKINSITLIPFMPIDFFKTEKILCNNIVPEKYFISSGTTSSKKSKHYIESIEFYEKSVTECFKRFWGDIHSYKFFCLTPEKKEAKNSSLVHMCDFFVKHTKHLKSGFYLNKGEKLKNDIIESQKKKTAFYFNWTYIFHS